MLFVALRLVLLHLVATITVPAVISANMLMLTRTRLRAEARILMKHRLYIPSLPHPISSYKMRTVIASMSEPMFLHVRQFC